MFAPLRRVARAVLDDRRRRLFRRAMRRLVRDPIPASGDRRLLAALVRGWANEGWSAWEEFLDGCATQARVADGPILECGSGLTTLVVGAVAQARGLPVWTLEHAPGWGARIQRELDAHGIASVRLCLAPIARYGDFAWYAPPLEAMPERFALVVCDGPPADVAGGRTGLLPVMGRRLAPGTVILLDDAGRPDEVAIARRWANQLGTRYRIVGRDKTYIRMTVPSAVGAAGTNGDAPAGSM